MLLIVSLLLLILYPSVSMLRSRDVRPILRLKSIRTFCTVGNSDYDYHVPVMREECCKYLNVVPGGVYVDCTLGGGGHTKAILELGGKVIGIDQDPDAIKRSKGILSRYIDSGDCEIIQTNFRNIKSAIERSTLAGVGTVKNGKVDGVLMDLGVSSFQINEASRGFAFGQDGPLDMRMNKGDLSNSFNIDDQIMYGKKKVISAYEIINTWDATAIADVLYHYGDEVRSRALAREIIAARPLNSTGDLESVISSKTSFKDRPKTLARCFQALRIVVNDEIGALEDALLNMHQCIRFGGTFVVMSYHSLEDRRVKQLFRTGSFLSHSTSTPGIQSSHYQTTDVSTAGSDAGEFINPWKCSFKKAIVASDAEVASNRRARSAKLRVAVQSINDHTANEELHEHSADVSNTGRRVKGKLMGLKEKAKMAKRAAEPSSNLS